MTCFDFLKECLSAEAFAEADYYAKVGKWEVSEPPFEINTLSDRWHTQTIFGAEIQSMPLA